MVRRRDIKKSEFTAVTDSESSDYFDFVRNGQNLRIAQSDLAAFLGASGELQTRGEATATPVLRVIGGINYIRNILGGSGINVQLSAQDGIEISHNFTIDDVGVPVIINSGSDSPIVRSIQAGGGISISGSGNIIQISSTDVPASTKTVVVYTITDFPEAVGDVITLEADTEYKLQNDVSSAYRYVLSSNTVLSSADATLIELEYTGIGVMFTAADVNFKIKEIFVSCSVATLFNISSSTNQHIFRMCNSNMICNDAGNIDGMALTYFHNCSFTDIYGDGLTFSGACSLAIFDTMGGTISAGTGSLITLGTATFDYFYMNKGLFQIDSSGYLISGLANSGNINAGGLGLISASRNFGTGAVPPTDNISSFDDRWEFQHNSDFVDSKNVMLATHAGGTITIATVATPVLVGATWTNQVQYRFTGTAAGTWTYNGNLASVEIVVSITASVATVADNISFFIYKNGVAIPASRVTDYVTNNQPSNMTLLWNEDIENGDYFQLYVQNDDTNVDVVIHRATMRIWS